MVVTANDVRSCYRVLLGREAENAKVVDDIVVAKPSFEHLLKIFVTSEEFQTRGWVNTFGQNYHNPPPKIEVDAGSKFLPALFERVKTQWERLGESDPYWSVLTSDHFKRDKIKENEAEFFGTGKVSARMVDEFYDRAGLKAPTGICFELGCGVGRVTRFLADQFESVYAVDVSKGNLKIAKELINTLNIKNIELRHLSGVEEFETVPPFDLLYSTIVLQHNPPPIQKFILNTLLQKVNPGGGCIFQIPTEMPGYQFNIRSYLKSEDTTMEMHSLPMKDVLELLLANGLTLKEVRVDPFTGTYGSYTFFAIKNTDATPNIDVKLRPATKWYSRNPLKR